MIPVILYIGRLKESRKGFELFLDALCILSAFRRELVFKTRVMGGDEEDVNWAIISTESRMELRDMLQKGYLEFWGRVENDALPEFYSRSTVLVVPSFREQFGIVAVEAMMCGCPVIASNIGGLREIVIDGITGTLFEWGNAAALSNVLASYIFNPFRAKWKGKNASVWVKSQFEADKVYAKFKSLYESPNNSRIAGYEDNEKLYRKLSIEQSIPIVEKMLQLKVAGSEDISSSPSLSYRINTSTGESFYVKKHAPRPTSLSCLFPVQNPNNGETLPETRIKLMEILQNTNIAPELVAYDLSEGIMIQKWYPEIIVNDFEEAKKCMEKVISKIQETQLYEVDENLIAAINGELDELVLTHDDSLLLEMDKMCSEINAPLFSGILRTKQVHPIIELVRLIKYIGVNKNLLPTNFAFRAESCINLLLSIRKLPVVSPKLGHGSMKTEHLLRGKHGELLVCDLDHCGYFFGPFDVAHWVWTFYNCNETPAPKAMLDALNDILSEPQEIFLAACWVLVIQLNRELWKFASGKLSEHSKTLSFLYLFPELCRRYLL